MGRCFQRTGKLTAFKANGKERPTAEDAQKGWCLKNQREKKTRRMITCNKRQTIGGLIIHSFELE